MAGRVNEPLRVFAELVSIVKPALLLRSFVVPVKAGIQDRIFSLNFHFRRGDVEAQASST
jgi:hypothetical protein